MNLKQLRYVIVLANAGSFSKAASILNISQPSLSQYVKKIEQQLGVELFERSNGSVRITEAGRVYIDVGRKILDLEHSMQNRFLDISENKSGTIIVGTSPFRSASFMPEVAADFRQRYPGIHLSISEMETHDLFESAEHGEFDMCITNLPVDDRMFDYKIITEEEIVLAVKKDSELDLKLRNVVKDKIDISSLDNENFVMLTENQLMQKTLDNICTDYNLNLKTAVVVKSIQAQIEMVCSGMGAALVPEGIKKLCANRVSYYSLSADIPKRKLAVIYKKDKHLSVPMLDLIEIIKSKKW